jgi:hypothetical protein
MEDAYKCTSESGREKFCTTYRHDSWVVANGWDVGGMQDIDMLIISWYWAATTITSVGYGDILPHNTGEYAFATVIEIVGSLLVAVLFGSMSLIATNLYQVRGCRRQRVRRGGRRMEWCVCVCVR